MRFSDSKCIKMHLWTGLCPGSYWVSLHMARPTTEHFWIIKGFRGKVKPSFEKKLHSARAETFALANF